jgi:Beta-propeller repeat
MTRSSTLRRPRRRVGCQPRLENLEGRQLLSLPPAFGSVLGVGSDTKSIAPWGNAVDADGYTYVTGMLGGTIDLDPNDARLDGSDILTPRGYTDAFVAKYAPDNSLVWARRMGGAYVYDSNAPLFQAGRDIAVDGSGNVYVTGEFVGQAGFGRFTLNSAGSIDVFVTKLDLNGDVVWAKSWGGATYDSGNGIAVDGAGNVVSVGSTRAGHPLNGGYSTGFEIHKYSPTGATVWAKRIDNTGGSASSVATDQAGNVYLCGGFAGKVDFNPDPRKTNYVTGASGGNGYVLELTAAGAFGWVSPFVAKTAESPGSHVSLNDLALDATGNVIIGGQYVGQIDFNPSPKIDYRLPNIGASTDGFVAKLSPAGSLAWATPLGGAVVDSVAVDTAGAVYATGSFFVTDLFTPGFGLPPATSHGRADAFVAALTASGAVDWAVTFGGTGDDAGRGIAVDAAGTIYVAGTYIYTVDFDPEHPGTAVLTNPSYTDMFLLKLKKR